MRKRKTITDFYMAYPYKKNYPAPIGTIQVPFVKEKDVTQHRNTVDYKQYTAILELFFEMKAEDITNGISYFPKSRIGEICFRKYKILDKHLVKYVKEWGMRNYFKNTIGQDRFCIKSTWERIRRSHVNRVSWRVKINQSLYRRVYQKCETDYTHMFKFRDA